MYLEKIKIQPSQNIWFSSDFHYNHKNIVSGVSQWDSTQTRNFQTLEEHNETLVNNINICCKENDILIFGGDWSFGGFQIIPIFREKLNVKTIYFTFGNHDEHIIRNKNGYQSLFTKCSFRHNLMIGKQLIVVDHFSKRVWEQSHKGSWMLYGHSHGNLPEYQGEAYYDQNLGHWNIKQYKTMDIGIDTHPEFRPYHFDEIKSIMDKRSVILIDHHTPETN